MNVIGAFLLKHRKPILQGLLALAIAYALYVGGKKLLAALTGEDDLSEVLPEPTQSSLTFPRARYKALADSMEQGLNGLFGLNMSGPLDILNSMVSRADLEQLIIAFGRRDLGVTWLGGIEGANLVQWITGRMWGNDLDEAKEIFSRLGMPI